LGEAEEKQKHAYNLIELSEANFLEKRSMLVYGKRKHIKSILRFTQKLLNNVNKLKNLLVRVKVIPRCSDKFARILEAYVKFRKLALPFGCIYANIKHIESMFNYSKIAAYWK